VIFFMKVEKGKIGIRAFNEQGGELFGYTERGRGVTNIV